MWALVLRRAHSQRVVLLVATLTLLLASTLLTALVGFARSAPDAGLALRFGELPPSAVTVAITAGVPGDALNRAGEAVRAAAGNALRGSVREVDAAYRSGSFALPGPANGATRQPELATLVELPDVSAHARLVTGQWPHDGGASDLVPVAVPEQVATALSLATGDRLALRDRLTQAKVLIDVVGVYQADDPNDVYWRIDPFGGVGMTRGTFLTRGPFVVTHSSLVGHTSGGVSAAWQVVPDLSRVRVADLPGLRSGLARLPDVLAADPALGQGAGVQDDLQASVAQAADAVRAARSLALVPEVLLGVLAFGAVLLTARLLADSRQREAALLQARGMSRRQRTSIAAREAVLLALPAAVLAPVLAGALFAAIPGGSGLRRALGWSTGLDAWPVAIGSGALSVAVLVAVDVASTGTAPRRIGPSWLATRAVPDVALVVVAGVAYFQLRRYGTAGDAGGLQTGPDPVVALAPLLLLAAGAVLVLRLVPVVARIAERLATPRRGVSAALGSWQGARGPVRRGGAGVFLVVCVGTCAWGIVHSATESQSQRDQAAFRAGADLRVSAPVGENATSPLGEAGALRHAAGGDARVMPVLRRHEDIGGVDADVLAVDASAARSVMSLRDDLAPRPLRTLLEPLVNARPEPQGIALPGRPSTVGLGLSLRSDQPGAVADATMEVVLRDGEGLLFVVPAGDVPVDGRRHRLTLDLGRLAGRHDAVPTYPVAVTGVILAFPPSLHRERLITLTLYDVTGSSGPGRMQPADATWTTRGISQPDLFPPPRTSAVDVRGALLSVGITTGRVEVPDPDLRQEVAAVLGLPLPAAGADINSAPAVPPVPGIVTRRVLATTGARIGATVGVDFDGVRVPVTVTSVVDALPTQENLQGGILVDLPTVAAATFRPDGALLPNEWWVSTTSPTASASVRSTPVIGTLVADRAALVGSYADDPLASGVAEGAVRLALLGAAVLALVGLGLRAATSARRHARQFALLRALGASGRDRLLTLGVEELLVVGVAVVGGLLAGAALAVLVAPLVLVGPDGGAPMPSVRPVLAWPTLAGLAVAVLAVASAITTTVGSRLLRAAPARALEAQHGEVE